MKRPTLVATTHITTEDGISARLGRSCLIFPKDSTVLGVFGRGILIFNVHVLEEWTLLRTRSPFT